jgi:hypothetical protein
VGKICEDLELYHIDLELDCNWLVEHCNFVDVGLELVLVLIDSYSLQVEQLDVVLVVVNVHLL